MVNGPRPSPTGGQSREGPPGQRRVLVTPSGQAVGSADPTRPRVRGAGGIRRQEEQTPEQLQKELPATTALVELQRLAQERGRGFSSLQIQRELRRQGFTVRDLNRENRINRETFRQTGVNPREVIKQEIFKEEVKVSPVTRDRSTPVIDLITGRDEPQFISLLRGDREKVFEKRVVDQPSVFGVVPFGPPQTAFVDTVTGRRATPSEERKLREQEVLELQPAPTRLQLRDVEFKESFAGEKIFRKDDKGNFVEVRQRLPFFLDPPAGKSSSFFVERNGKKVPFNDKSLQKFIEQELNALIEKGGSATIGRIAPSLPGSVETLLDTKVSGFSNTAILKSVFFGPAFQTAAAAKAKTTTGKAKQQVAKQKQKAKKNVKKKEVTRAFEEEFKKGNFEEIDKKLSDISKIIQQQTDLEKKSIGIKNFADILEDLQKKGVIKNFVLDTNTGRFQLFGAKTINRPTAKPTVEVDLSDLARIGQLRQAGKIKAGITSAPTEPTTVFGRPSRFAGTGLFEKSEFTASRISFNRQSVLSKQLDSVRERLRTADSGSLRNSLTNRENQLTRQLNRLKELDAQKSFLNSRNQLDQLNRQLSLSKTAQRSLERQLSATTSLSRQESLTKQLQRQATLQKLLTTQIQQTRLTLKNLQKSGVRFGRPTRPFRPGKPLPLPKFGKKKTKLIATKKPLKKPFEVFVRKRGKDVSIGKFKSQLRARKALRTRIKTTLRASGFIFDKRRGERLRPRTGVGFRLGKKDPFRLVEKRNFRLTKGSGEVRAIQKARKAAKPFKPVKSKMKSTKMIRRKK